MNPKISVIVPVYKAEKYLRRCVESILAQTFTNLEVLLIDDGSPDKSNKICDEFAQVDNRVRVFHTENRGVTMARKLGVEHSIGEWVTFVDSDDYLYEYAFETLIAHTKNVDMVSSCIEDKQKIWYQKKEGRLNREELILSLIYGETYGALHAALFHRKLFSKETFSCPSDIKIGEDVLMKLQLAKRTKMSININVPVYFYYTNEESVMQSQTRSILYYLRYNKLRNSIIDHNLVECLINRDFVEYLRAFYNRNIPFRKEYYNALINVIKDKKYNNVIPSLSKYQLFLYKMSHISFLAITYKHVVYYLNYILKRLLHQNFFVILD